MLYWPFSTSDLYNWKTPNAKFSDNPRDLIGLLGPVLFTHQPTWEDCQQLLQVLFATEERERIQVEAQKSVLGEDRQPTQNPDLRNAAFPLSCPTWDYNSAEGKERPRVHRQTLMAGLQAAAHKPTNLAKVYDVRQGKDESPAAFLERVIEAFRQYTPMDPEAPETKAAIIMTFVNQAAPGIKKKLQRVERLGEKSLQDLVIVAERVYNNRQSPEEQQTKLSDRQTRNLAKILLATTMDNPQERRRHFKKLASGTETQAEGEAGSMHWEPDVGFDPRSPGSRPGPKAGTKPLRHPGIPRLELVNKPLCDCISVGSLAVSWIRDLGHNSENKESANLKLDG
ncbi:unnamed protein product [Nyctereutes procyonoides]|uniref:(raccoon dog) hypothetical protein n=1 Tax=Nyctereutes procyonoides TaxID=34880 RepID=A0A811ZB71_NYCPR|nr:unnamed protein product [Nyctereutes procyonoides]